MLQVGKHNFCTVTEFLSEGVREAGDVTFFLFGNDVHSESILLPEKMSDKNAQKRIRTKLSQLERLKGSPMFAFTRNGRSGHFFYVTSILESDRKKYKVTFAPAAALLEYISPSFREGRGGEPSLLFLVNLDDKENSVAACFVHEGQEQLTRVFCPENREDFYHDVRETITQIRREFSHVDLLVRTLGFPEEAGIQEVLEGTDCEPVEEKLLAGTLPQSSFFNRPKQYPVKTIAAVASVTAAVAATIVFITAAVQLSWSEVEYNQAKRIKIDNENRVKQHENLIAGYEDLPTQAQWTTVLSSVDILRNIIEKYPFTFEGISLVDVNNPRSQATQKLVVEGRLWALESESIADDILRLSDDVRRINAKVVRNDLVPADESGDWFSKTIKVESEVYANATRKQNKSKNRPVGRKSASVEVYNDSGDRSRDYAANGALPVRAEQEKQGGDSFFGERSLEVVYSIFRTAADFVTGAKGVAVGIALANQDTDSIAMGGKGNAELPSQPVAPRRDTGLESRSATNNVGSHVSKPARAQSRTTGTGTQHQTRGQQDLGNYRGADPANRPILTAGPNRGGLVELEFLKKEYERVKAENRKVQQEMTEIQNRRDNMERSMTKVNPPSYYLVSTTPQSIVLRDEQGRNLFVDINDVFYYGKRVFKLTNIALGQRAEFVGEMTPEGLYPKLVFLQGHWTKPLETTTELEPPIKGDDSEDIFASVDTNAMPEGVNVPQNVGAMPEYMPGEGGNGNPQGFPVPPAPKRK